MFSEQFKNESNLPAFLLTVHVPGYVSLTFIKGHGLGQYDGACQCN